MVQELENLREKKAKIQISGYTEKSFGNCKKGTHWLWITTTNATVGLHAIHSARIVSAHMQLHFLIQTESLYPIPTLLTWLRILLAGLIWMLICVDLKTLTHHFLIFISSILSFSPSESHSLHFFPLCWWSSHEEQQLSSCINGDGEL